MKIMLKITGEDNACREVASSFEKLSFRTTVKGSLIKSRIESRPDIIAAASIYTSKDVITPDTIAAFWNDLKSSRTELINFHECGGKASVVIRFYEDRLERIILDLDAINLLAAIHVALEVSHLLTPRSLEKSSGSDQLGSDDS